MDLEDRLLFASSSIKFELRTLVESDVTKEYVMSLAEAEHIENAASIPDIEKQRICIRELRESEDRLICGLFFAGKFVGSTGVQVATQ